MSTDLLNGYRDPPAGVKVGRTACTTTQVFPGHQIAMPPPLSADQVTYADGTPNTTLEQESPDIATFLTYIRQPGTRGAQADGRENRPVPGWCMTVLTYAVKPKIWAGVH